MKKDILGRLITVLFCKERAQCQMHEKRSKKFFEAVQNKIRYKRMKKG
jgi:hypothetical protein